MILLKPIGARARWKDLTKKTCKQQRPSAKIKLARTTSLQGSTKNRTARYKTQIDLVFFFFFFFFFFSGEPQKPKKHHSKQTPQQPHVFSLFPTATGAFSRQGRKDAKKRFKGNLKPRVQKQSNRNNNNTKTLKAPNPPPKKKKKLRFFRFSAPSRQVMEVS